MRLWHFAFINLIRRPFQNLLLLGALSIAVASGGILLRTYSLAKLRQSQMVRGPEAIIGPKTSSLNVLLSALNLEETRMGFIPLQLYQTLKQKGPLEFGDGTRFDPNSTSGTPKLLIPFLIFAKSESYPIIATNLDFYQQSNIKIQQGVAPRSYSEVAVGAMLAHKLKLKLGDDLAIELWPNLASPNQTTYAGEMSTLKVSAILEEQKSAWDFAAFSNLDVALDSLGRASARLGRDESIWHHQVLNFILVYTSKSKGSDLENLINLRSVAQIIWVDDERAFLSRLIDVGGSLGWAVALVFLVLLTCTLGALGLQTYETQILQIAILRALGYSKLALSVWIFLETLYISLASVVLGECIAAPLFDLMRPHLESLLPNQAWYQLSSATDWPIWLSCFVATSCAAIWSIQKIQRSNTHELLQSI